MSGNGNPSQIPRRKPRLIALTVLGALLFNFPLLSLFASGEAPFGLPLPVVYLFGAWGLLIALIAWVQERGERGDQS